jgi:hypothetical protein
MKKREIRIKADLRDAIHNSDAPLIFPSI